jgi:5-methylcytosine-specific restriction endonuclease McrA
MPQPRRANGFYDTPEWKSLRLAALQRASWRCTICGVCVAGARNARVDHVKPLSTHPHLALTASNLRVLCPACDNQAHREKWRGKNATEREEKFVLRGCGLDGWPHHRPRQ